RFVMGGKRQGRHGTLRSLGNRVFNLLADLMFAGNVSDGFSSFRAIRRSKLAEVTVSGGNLSRFFALSVEALKRGWRIQEIPTVEVTKSSSQIVSDAASSIVPAVAILARGWWSQRRLHRGKPE